MSLLIFRLPSSDQNAPTIWAVKDNHQRMLYKLHDFDRVCWNRESLVQLRNLINDTLIKTNE